MAAAFSAGGMNTASGLKHVATEPAQLGHKRERRQVASGRAAVLRRAPSDSDCSIETGSLSADSAERRPLPSLERVPKSRSRRRGSEWEVLEGLKDGQRFEKRPEVFNGYLQKKRKWPLKGWHKRFFVIDGGILVYARSPTDVARGRLHGSVDVGLSVISAKQRRRRIDIDADEFIFHLKAKTQDVFRTWLLVLKAHRLYRQHLLTFGTREQAPKILAPDELPTNEGSSTIRKNIYPRRNKISLSYDNSNTGYNFSHLKSNVLTKCKSTTEKILRKLKYKKNESKKVLNFNRQTHSKIQSTSTDRRQLKRSIDKMAAISRYSKERPSKNKNRVVEINSYTVNIQSSSKRPKRAKKPVVKQLFKDRQFTKFENRNDIGDSSNYSDSEYEISETQYVDSFKMFPKEQSDIQRCKKRKNSASFRRHLEGDIVINSSNNSTSFEKLKSDLKSSMIEAICSHSFKDVNFNKRNDAVAYVMLCNKGKNAQEKGSQKSIQKSKKCTNVVKYKNVRFEPPLKHINSKCMLLNKLIFAQNLDPNAKNNFDARGTPKNDIQSKKLAEYELITQRIVETIFDVNKPNNQQDVVVIKTFVRRAIKELCETKVSSSQQVQQLFKNLLEFYLTSSNSSQLMGSKQMTSVASQVEKRFQDAYCSQVMIITDNKGTQTKTLTCNALTDSDYYDTDMLIQKLEKTLKNTIYVCEIDSKMQKMKQNLSQSDNDASNYSVDQDRELSRIHNVVKLMKDIFVATDVPLDFLEVYFKNVLNDRNRFTFPSVPFKNFTMNEQSFVVATSRNETKQAFKSQPELTNVSDKSVNHSSDLINDDHRHVNAVIGKITSFINKCDDLLYKTYNYDIPVPSKIETNETTSENNLKAIVSLKNHITTTVADEKGDLTKVTTSDRTKNLKEGQSLKPSLKQPVTKAARNPKIKWSLPSIIITSSQKEIKGKEQKCSDSEFKFDGDFESVINVAPKDTRPSIESSNYYRFNASKLFQDESVISLLRKNSMPKKTSFDFDGIRTNKFFTWRDSTHKFRVPSKTEFISFTQSDDLVTLYRCLSEPSFFSGRMSPTVASIRGPQAGFVCGTPGGRLASWIIESGGPLENASKELGQAQLSVQQLQRLLDALEMQQQVHHDTDVSLEGASPNVKKDRRKFGLRKKKSNSKCASVELAPPQYIDTSNSHMALSALTAPPSPGGGASSVPNSAASLPIACAAARPQSLPGAEALGGAGGPASLSSLTPDHQLREDFTVVAKDLVQNLKSIVGTLICERGRLRAAMDAAETTSSPGGAVVAALRTNLSSALQQNSELRTRLSRIHDASDLTEISSMGHNSDPVTRFQQSLSYSSSCVSASEFFDAEEHDDSLKPPELIQADEAGVIELDGDSSSEVGSMSSEEGSASSDNSEGALMTAQRAPPSPETTWRRRSRLPRPRPTPGGPSLWNLLYKNIGKDLSQISMPVTINEPLNMLQRLCEELEYSELLDAASECSSGTERAALVAAFAVSAYAGAAHRAASKPFNPLLGETYECLRDDKGFRFIAEQVSHHPPISACHAESPRWLFWQEARIKTRFWGKSMEFQPAGRVHLKFKSTGDHYSWNKVTTCVHNLFGGQRWVDQYGEMHIKCHGTDINCKLHFVKASSWSTSRHEVRGAINGAGAPLRLAGRWSEALTVGEPPRCLWRPGAMPPDYELYYGFTRFAMELNELEPGMREVLPHTDTRLRPDQRALEEGDVDAAEHYKHQLEEAQRERRRDSPEHTPKWFRKSYENGEEMWVFNGEYWKAREAGFSDDGPKLW